MRALARQKRAIDALTASETRFRATFDQAAIGMARVDPKGLFLQVNQKLCDMLGYTRDELLAMTAFDIVLPEERNAYAGERAQLISGEFASYSREMRYVRKDGALLWVNRTVSLVRDAAGQPLYFIRVIEDITERKHLQQELQHLAHHDSLTRLPNRKMFYDRLEHALGQARRRNWTTGVMFIDLDGFKVVNDTLGHGVGDQLLQQVSARLTQCVRADDTVGRLGGDEFAVILSELAREQDGGLVARKIIDALAKPFQIDGHEVQITASIGITICPPDSGDAGVLLSNADAAMYAAKKLGKNNYQFYAAAIDAQAMNRLRTSFSPVCPMPHRACGTGADNRHMAHRSLKWAGGVFLALAVLAVLFVALFDWNWLRGPIARWATEKTGRELALNGDLSVKLRWPLPRIRAEGVTFANPRGRKKSRCSPRTQSKSNSICPSFSRNTSIFPMCGSTAASFFSSRAPTGARTGCWISSSATRICASASGC